MQKRRHNAFRVAAKAFRSGWPNLPFAGPLFQEASEMIKIEFGCVAHSFDKVCFRTDRHTPDGFLEKFIVIPWGLRALKRCMSADQTGVR